LGHTQASAPSGQPHAGANRSTDAGPRAQEHWLCDCEQEANDLESIATAQGESNTLAVYAFKVQRNRRYFVQRTVIVAKVKLVERNPKISAMAW